MKLFKSTRFASTRKPDLTYTVLEAPQLSIPLDGVSTPLSEKAAAEIRRNTDAIVKLQAQANVARLGRELDTAEQALQGANNRLGVAQAREGAATAELQATGRPNYVQTTFYGACAAAALSCEFALSYQTLPPLLGLAMDSWLAVAVGAAPVAAAVAIEMILDGILAALNRGRSIVSRRWLPAIAWTTLGILAVGVLLLNGGMIWKIASAREESSRLLALLGQYTDTPLVINEAVVTAAILAVSFVVVINAAILLQAVMPDFHNIALHRGAAGRLRRARREMERAQEQVHSAKASFATAQRSWEQREETTKALTEAVRSRAEFQLQQLRERSKPPAVSLDDMIDRVLVSAHDPTEVFRFAQEGLSSSLN